MEKFLFAVTCTTCQAKLRVRDFAAVGSIVHCPKCQSMVLIQPPAGWTPPAEGADTLPEIEPPQPAGPPPLPTTSLPPATPEADVSAGDETAQKSGSALRWCKKRWPALAFALVVLVFFAWALAPPGTPTDEPEEPPVELPAGPGEAIEEPVEPQPEKPADKPAVPGTAEKLEQENKQFPNWIAWFRATAPKLQPPDWKNWIPDLTRPASPEKPKPASEKPAAKVAATPKDKPKPGPFLPRDPLPDVDVTPRLARPIADFQLKEMPLAEFVEFAGQLGGFTATIDPDAIQRLGATLDSPISVKLTAATLRDVLNAGLKTAGLSLTLRRGQPVIGGAETDAQTLYTLRYAVEDLAGRSPAELKAFADRLQRLVAPDMWQRSPIAVEGDNLKIDQTAIVHDRIVDFCERLRTARKLPLRSRYDAERFSLRTRWNRVAMAIERPVTANFPRPTSLARVLSVLEDAGTVRITVDWADLRPLGISAETLALVKANQKPLAAALDEVLAPLGLAVRPIDVGWLHVGGQKAIQARRDLEFYPAADLIARLGGPQLLRRLASDGATLEIDEPSGHVLALASPPTHAALEKRLAELRKKKP